MISEEQQDQAALYALGLLAANEDAAFESELTANAELRDLVRELREAAGNLALTAPSLPPPASLKHRIMREIAMKTEERTVVPLRRPAVGWVPWAIDAEHKDPISAGIIRVDQNGVAQVRFKPVEKAEHVKAFAISLEREGGVPKKEGPILLVGTT